MTYRYRFSDDSINKKKTKTITTLTVVPSQSQVDSCSSSKTNFAAAKRMPFVSRKVVRCPVPLSWRVPT